MISNYFRLSTRVLLLLLVILMASCASRKDVVYFQDTGNFETIVSDNQSLTKFKIDDVVSIHVASLNPEASVPFNLFRGASEGGIQAQQVDYLVDQKGEIDFPVIGKLKIQGLSPDELRALLTDKLFDYLKDPIINIRLRNFTITVLGAVSRAGTYPVNGEQITILEALGLAGDMTIRGRRDNVLVIRDFDGTKVYNRVNLTSKEMTKSPVYYLTQNDVVYVEQNESGIKETSLDARAGLYVSIVSVLITATAIFLTRN